MQQGDCWAAAEGVEALVTAPRKKAAARKAKPKKIDLHSVGARVVSVFGPFANRALIEMPVDRAAECFPKPLGVSGRTAVVEAVTRDLAELAKRDKGLSESGLAALALALAYEIEHPYNSATAKANCAGRLQEALERLRDLAPSEEESDGLDDLAAKRTARRAKAAS